MSQFASISKKVKHFLELKIPKIEATLIFPIVELTPTKFKIPKIEATLEFPIVELTPTNTKNSR